MARPEGFEPPTYGSGGRGPRSRPFAMVRLHVFPALGHLRLARLTPVAVEAFYKDLQTSLSGATIVFIHRMLHKAFRDAVRKGLLMRNPASSEFVDAPKKGTF